MERKIIKMNRLEYLRSEYKLGKYSYDEFVFIIARDCVTTLLEINWTELQYGMSEKACAARSVFCYLVYKYSNYSFRQIAEKLNKSKASIHALYKKMQFYVETPNIYREYTQVVEYTVSMIDRHIVSQKLI